MPDSVFEIKKSAIPTKKISIVVEENLANQIDEIQNQLGEKYPDKKFNVNAICVRALAQAVRQADKELKQMAAESGHSGGGFIASSESQ